MNTCSPINALLPWLRQWGRQYIWAWVLLGFWQSAIAVVPQPASDASILQRVAAARCALAGTPPATDEASAGLHCALCTSTSLTALPAAAPATLAGLTRAARPVAPSSTGPVARQQPAPIARGPPRRT